MTAAEARALTEANKATAIRNQYGLMKRMIEWKASRGYFSIPIPSDSWPEVIDQLKSEGYVVRGNNMYWGVNEPKNEGKRQKTEASV